MLNRIFWKRCQHSVKENKFTNMKHIEVCYKCGAERIVTPLAKSKWFNDLSLIRRILWKEK